MLKKIFQNPPVMGLELNTKLIKCAEVLFQNGKPHIEKLFTVSPDAFNVKQLYTDQSILVTGMDATEVLIRGFHLPLTKEKEIAAALLFQAEPLLPYPADQAILSRQTLSQDNDGTNLTLLSTRKDLLKKHLEQWEQYGVEPEKISCIPSALCFFEQNYVKSDKAIIVLHVDDKWMSCVLVKQGKLLASYTHQEGLELLTKALETDNSNENSLQHIDFTSLPSDNYRALSDAFKRIQQALAKMCFALSKDYKDEIITDILITGDSILLPSFDKRLTEKLNLNLLNPTPEANFPYTSSELQQYAIPIGLALGSNDSLIDFRQQEYIYPHPWKRIKLALASYFILMLVLAVTFYFFGQTYLKFEEDKLRQEYVELLGAMNKSFDHFEQTYVIKNPQAKKSNGEIASVMELNRADLFDRLEFLQKDIQTAPDSFPLFANTPNVSDVLAWLSNHPNIMHKKADGTMEARLQLENFSFVMLKRPAQGKKQEKYQIKIELDFSSPTPKWAREFHDSLIAPNDYVDPKAEVKWTTNRGHYRTSFYLKDKTIYPSQ
ncbi:MAG: hypothetical protein H0W88_03700 [Parachlamydiaceae bacterium]|nr:hypothetical protein [Parachlamydiaceae bacterium]